MNTSPLKCAECGAEIRFSASSPDLAAWKGPDNLYYCTDCFHGNFIPCDQCGEAIKPGTGVKYVTEGYSLCDKCLGLGGVS